MDASTQDYLKRIEDGLHLAGRAIQEINNRFQLNHARLVEEYREGRCWLLCDLHTGTGINQGAFLACASAEKTVFHYDPVCENGRQSYPRYLIGRNQEPVLVDIAQLVQSPEGVPLATLVCLYLIDHEVGHDRHSHERFSAGDLTSEPLVIVGEGKTDAVWRAREWSDNGYRDVIEGAAEIADGISDNRIDALVGLLERIKNNFHPSPALYRLKMQGIEICTMKPTDPGLKIGDVFAATLKL